MGIKLHGGDVLVQPLVNVGKHSIETEIEASNEVRIMIYLDRLVALVGLV